MKYAMTASAIDVRKAKMWLVTTTAVWSLFMALVSFTLGKGTEGTGRSRKSHRGFHPSFT